MTERFHKASPYKTIEYDPSKVSELVIQAIEDKINRVLVVLEDEGKAVGMITGVAQEHLMNREKTAFELIWWVDDEYRNSLWSVKLFEAFEYWAKRVGCKYIVTGSAYGTDATEKVDKFYNKRKFQKTESSYFKVIS